MNVKTRLNFHAATEIAHPFLRRLRWIGNERVFCISIQRNGTSSTGKFLEKLGYPTAGWPVIKRNEWGEKCFTGDYDGIFRSWDFRSHQAFQDGPWFQPKLYRAAFQKFPNSKFILFERDPHSWFESMLAYKNGKTLGVTDRHCEFYRREEDYFSRLDEGIDVPEKMGLSLEGWEEHYVAVYKIYNRTAKEFFAQHAPENLFCGHLEDENKWDKLARFLGQKNSVGDVHVNKSR